MEDPPIEGEVISDTVIDPAAEDDAKLQAYLDEIVTRGFPLSLLERVLGLLKGAGFAAGSAVAGLVSYLLLRAALDFTSAALVASGILLLFDCAAWIFTLYLVILGLGNIAAALFGRMPLHTGAMNERFES